MLKINFKKLSQIFLIFAIIIAWVFSGWPQIWQNPPLPPEVEVARAETREVFTETPVGGTWQVPEGVTSVKVLVVAGGGGGGQSGSYGVGGGGAGGVVYNDNYSVTPLEEITVTVGAGGAGATTYTEKGGNGENSAFGSITTIGGGGGSSTVDPGLGGNDGGSGGGGGYSAAGGSGTAGQGNDGGDSTGNNNGGGGGGKGAAGADGSSNDGGNGGAGAYYGDTFGDDVGVSGWFGGGGGGAGTGVDGSGGQGGGGEGNGINGTVNTGGGGGGGIAVSGGAGGSGVVIVLYEEEVNQITIADSTLDQPTNVNEGDTAVVMGAFTFIADTSTATVTSIKINEEGTVNANSNLSNIKLYSQEEATCTFAGSTQLGTTQSFDGSDEATFGSLSLSVGTTTQQCVFVVLDVGSDAGGDNTIEIEITSSSDVSITDGGPTGSFPVQISGTTTIRSDSGTIVSTEVDFDWTGETDWGEVIWNTTETQGDVVLKVYYTVSTACDTVVPNSALSGNETGFQVSASPLDISGLNTTTYNRICLQATLTAGASASPTLDDWGITWEPPDVGQAPTVDSVSINPSPITLNTDSTKTVTITATITDNDGCEDVFTSGSITGVFFDDAVENDTCTQDDNDCYTSLTLTEVDDTCTGAGDYTADASVDVDVWFIANPSSSWTAKVTATDEASESGSNTQTVTINTLNAFKLNVGSIGYGTVYPNNVSSQQAVLITTTGNAAIDVQLSGTNLTWSGNTIDVSQQKYSADTGFDWETQGTALTDTATCHELSTGKPTEHPSVETENVYWKLKVPTGKGAGGPYEGTNYFDVVSETTCP